MTPAEMDEAYADESKLRDRLQAAHERAIAAEQRAEQLDAQVCRLKAGTWIESDVLCQHDMHHLAVVNERARVVEAIVAELYAMDAPDLAGHIRSHNWAAPEEES